MTPINIVNKSQHEVPTYATLLAAGADIKANIDAPLTLKPLERIIVPTGLYIELMPGFEAQIRPRSGLAIKNGITVLNAPGTIDADDRGEVGVILVNLSNDEYTINDGDRIAQMVVARHEQADFIVIEQLSATLRADGGFGHTGK
jgi:dUTP pyrophosphatase